MSTTVISVQQEHAVDGDIELLPRDLHHVPQPPRASVSNEQPSIDKAVIAKIAVAGFSFFFVGTNDGSLGALTPYILRTYHMGTQYIALMYVWHHSTSRLFSQKLT